MKFLSAVECLRAEGWADESSRFSARARHAAALALIWQLSDLALRFCRERFSLELPLYLPILVSPATAAATR